MNWLRDAFIWVLTISALTSIVPGVLAVMLGRARSWPIERTRTFARWTGVGLPIAWWMVAVYGFRFLFPFDWIGASIGTPVRVLATVAWWFSPGYFAPKVVDYLWAHRSRSV